METKQIIIIGVLIVIICVLVGAIFGTLTNSVNYERIEIVPNGTSIEVPTNDAQYLGDKEGVKFWNWSNGALVTYNSQEGSNAVELSGALGFYAIKELVRSGASENIDGFTVYQLNGQQLSNTNISANGDVFYCIHLVNETTHDNIVICCEDKDVALHIAKSIEYKISNSNNDSDNTTASTSSSGNSSGLVPVTMDDGTVIYCHPGEYIDKQDGIYRVNSDGSLTKIADGSAEVQEYDADEDTDYYEDPSDFSDSSSSSGGSSSGGSSGGGSSSGSGASEAGSSDVESTVE